MVSIPGYIGKYSLGEDGKVFSHLKNKFILPVNNGAGYLKVSLCYDGKVKNLYVHRLVALTFIPNPNNLPQVNHIDGNKQNNHFSNLEWCTPIENITHAIDKRLFKFKNPRTADNKRIAVHGMLGEYNNYKCRCIFCKKANNEYQKQYKKQILVGSFNG